jgi:hypothetical protein
MKYIERLNGRISKEVLRIDTEHARRFKSLA